MAGRRVGWAALAVAAVTLLGGCGAGQLTQTAGQAASSGGAAGEIGTIQLRDAMITYDGPIPGNAVYDPPRPPDER